MIQGKFRNGKIKAWLFPVVIVLSLFAFSGINGPSAARQYTTVTEQNDPIRVSNKRCVTFKINGAKSSSRLYYTAENFQLITFSFSHAVKTQINQCAKHCLEFDQVNIQVTQYTPRSSDEHILIS